MSGPCRMQPMQGSSHRKCRRLMDILKASSSIRNHAEGFDPCRRRFGRLFTGSIGAVLPAWLGQRAKAAAQPAAPDGLERSSPKEQGVDARAIDSFLDDI